MHSWLLSIKKRKRNIILIWTLIYTPVAFGLRLAFALTLVTGFSSVWKKQNPVITKKVDPSFTGEGKKHTLGSRVSRRRHTHKRTSQLLVWIGLVADLREIWFFFGILYSPQALWFPCLLSEAAPVAPVCQSPIWGGPSNSTARPSPVKPSERINQIKEEYKRELAVKISEN